MLSIFHQSPVQITNVENTDLREAITHAADAENQLAAQRQYIKMLQIGNRSDLSLDITEFAKKRSLRGSIGNMSARNVLWLAEAADNATFASGTSSKALLAQGQNHLTALQDKVVKTFETAKTKAETSSSTTDSSKNTAIKELIRKRSIELKSETIPAMVASNQFKQAIQIIEDNLEGKKAIHAVRIVPTQLLPKTPELISSKNSFTLSNFTSSAQVHRAIIHLQAYYPQFTRDEILHLLAKHINWEKPTRSADIELQQL